MSYLFDLPTLFITTYWGIKNLKNISSSSRYLLYYIFFFVFAVPLYLDYIVGFPAYSTLSFPSRYWGFIESYDNLLTRVFYDVFLLFFQFVILNWQKRKTLAILQMQQETVLYEEGFSNQVKYISIVIALFTPFLTVLLGQQQILFAFGWRDAGNYSTIFDTGYYSILEKLSYLGVTASLFLIMMKVTKKGISAYLLKLLAILCLIMNICIESKRSIIFFCFIVVIIIRAFGFDKPIKPFRLLLAIGCLLGIVILLSVIVKTSYRGYTDFDSLYTTLRIDMFRDDTVKMALYSTFHRDRISILSYPFESYLMQIRSIFPLDIISGLGILDIPGVGYNTYFTCALAHVDLSYGYNWMTTSMFDELIANFGIIGILIAPFICVKISQKIDSLKKFEKILWLSAVVLLFMYSLNYIMYFLEGTFIITLLLKRQSRKKSDSCIAGLS